MSDSCNFIKVNGKPFPAPKRYPNLVVTTAVNAARNANNKVVGQKIGRDNYKIDNLGVAVSGCGHLVIYATGV